MATERGKVVNACQDVFSRSIDGNLAENIQAHYTVDDKGRFFLELKVGEVRLTAAPVEIPMSDVVKGYRGAIAPQIIKLKSELGNVIRKVPKGKTSASLGLTVVKVVEETEEAEEAEVEVKEVKGKK